MTGGSKIIMAVALTLAAPAYAVEAVYLDDLPITYPGEYLAPENLYLQVPPPTGVIVSSSGSFVPASLYDIGLLNTQPANTLTTSAVVANGTVLLSDDSDRRTGKIRVFITNGLDNVSDVPVAVFREHFAESEDIEVVADGEVYDYLVEVETMKPDGSPLVFIVINAYKDVDDKRLIFYNNFGYMGELKLLSGSTTYAAGLESALLKEAELLAEE